jgi:hypothetical protein
VNVDELTKLRKKGLESNPHYMPTVSTGILQRYGVNLNKIKYRIH